MYSLLTPNDTVEPDLNVETVISFEVINVDYKIPGEVPSEYCRLFELPEMLVYEKHHIVEV